MRIAPRLGLLTIGLVAATSALIGGTGYWGYRSILRAEQQRSLERFTEDSTTQLSMRFAELRDDLRILAATPDVESIAAATPGRDAAMDRTSRVLATLLTVKPWYVQARLIRRDDGGREVLRLDRADKQPTRAAEHALQQKGDRDYMIATEGLAPGAFYLSDITLNREAGEIEIPHRPMVRGIMGIAGPSGEQWGVVIINVAFDALVASTLPEDAAGLDYHVTNHEGDYLIHPDPSYTFGFDLGVRRRVQDDIQALGALFSDAAETQVVRAPAGAAGAGRLVLAKRVDVFGPGDPRFLTLVVASQGQNLAQETRAIGVRLVAVALALTAVAAVTALWFSTRLARPLVRLSEAAKSSPAGLDASVLETDRDDEIGDLSRALLSMMRALDDERDALRRTNERLERSNSDLEHFAHMASHDLREPARRVAAMTDLLRQAGGASEEESRLLLERTQAAAIQMLDQLTDFRALVGIGHGELVRERIDISRIVTAVLHEFGEEIETREVSVELGVLPETEGYTSLVDVLYRALVQNALRFAEGECFHLTFGSIERSGRTYYTVRNTRSWMARPDWDRVFLPFTKLQPGGRGIGLSMCRRIVERHGGAIEVESGGTGPSDGWVEFRFTLERSEHA